jgi:hypothetical protein
LAIYMISISHEISTERDDIIGSPLRRSLSLLGDVCSARIQKTAWGQGLRPWAYPHEGKSAPRKWQMHSFIISIIRLYYQDLHWNITSELLMKFYAER